MSTRWLAERLDDAFIRLGIRPSLPLVTSSSPLARLKEAEERTRIDLTDAVLFPPLSAPSSQLLHSRLLPNGVHLNSFGWTAPKIPLESEWNLELPEPTVLRTDWYTRSPRRPLLVGVSGWVPIRAFTTRLFWPLQVLDRIGFDVVLEREAVRSASRHRSLRVDFPSGDPCRNVLGVAKRVGAIRQILAHARGLGYDRIVVWGTSLGAHLAALLGTLTPREFDALVLEKPLARLSDSMRLHGPGNDADRHGVALRLDGVYRAVTALERHPRVEPNRVHVIGARYDRVTTFERAEEFASHFGASFEAVEASHLFDPGRSRRFEIALGRLS